MTTLQEVLKLVNTDVQESDFKSISIQKALPITDEAFNQNCIGWCSDSNGHVLTTLQSGTVLVSKNLYTEVQNRSKDLVLIPVTNPRAAFIQVLTHFFAPQKSFGTIHPSAFIDDTVEIDLSQVEIGPNVVIENGCKIGKSVSIGANTVIKSGTIVGDECAIGSNNTIGGVGFGYELNESNEYVLMPHIGNVVLNKGVEVGNNVCIDRAVMGSTSIGDNVKIDNLVHVAHGVQIGKNSLIIAHAMIAGSVTIGENVWVAPSSSIRQKLTIADNSVVGMGSVVVRNVDPNTTVAGNPAKLFEKK